jgi:hypothetical protein
MHWGLPCSGSSSGSGLASSACLTLAPTSGFSSAGSSDCDNPIVTVATTLLYSVSLYTVEA